MQSWILHMTGAFACLPGVSLRTVPWVASSCCSFNGIGDGTHIPSARLTLRWMKQWAKGAGYWPSY